MDKPLVTIGIPAYNERAYIDETIQSALSQTYGAVEVVVSDNASTDGTYDAIAEAADRDVRVVALKNDENLGALDNFRRVRDYAKGDFFMWLGGHDILDPGFVAEAVGKLASPACAMVFPQCNFVDEAETSTVLLSGDSDIDTSDVDILAGPVMVALNLVKCSAIHGLFRSALIKGLPLERIYGGDDLILFLTSAYGHLEKSSEICLLRRHPRVGESAEQRRARYEQADVIRRRQGLDRAVTAAYHIKWIWKLRHFSTAERLWLRYSGAAWPTVLTYEFGKPSDKLALPMMSMSPKPSRVMQVVQYVKVELRPFCQEGSRAPAYRPDGQ
jgi:glycosyltransferase involved in cell wall biosynthesis